MINQKGRTLLIILLIAAAIGGYLVYSGKINLNKPKVSPTSITQSSPTDETANWKTYTNTTYGYTIKYPDTYEVPAQSEREISQLGVDTNVCVQRKSDTTCLIVIDVYNNSSNLSLESYVKTNFKSLVDGPLIPYQGDGYSSLFVKNHPGTDEFRIRNSNIYHINAPTASSNKEIGDVLATFKFTDQTFKSEKGSFAIDLPSDMKMIERPERVEGGVTNGEVWFTFGQFDEHAPSGLVVTYGKPMIYGKGGACGEGGYKNEMISGQKVHICETNSVFSASYFTHPSKKIEYSVNTARLSTEQLKIVSNAVRKTLRFE